MVIRSYSPRSQVTGVEHESKTHFAILLFTGAIIFGLFFGLFVEIVSYALELFIYKINDGWMMDVSARFSEMMSLPDSQINTTYWLLVELVELAAQLQFGIL